MRGDSCSHGLWERSAPAAPALPPFEGDQRTRVAIIGAGYTGLSAALHLAEAGRAVTVLEAAEPGFGASGRNVGLVNAGMWVMPDDLPGVLGADYGSRLLDFLGNAPAEVFALVERLGIPCEAVHRGTLHLAVGDKGLREITDRMQQWRARGAPVELLSAGETRRRLGGGDYAGSLLDHRAGTIQPLAYARGLARAALAAGARIHGDAAVTDVSHDGTEWVLRTARGTLRAEWLIPATDAYTARVFPQILTEQVILPYFNMATPSLPGDLAGSILPGREGCWDTPEVLSSFRMDQAGRLVWGSVGRLGGAFAAAERAAHHAWALRAMHRVFPQLKGVGFETFWWGRIGMTADALPRLHQPGPNAIAICGYNGRGIAPGTVCGRALARHVLGEWSIGEMPLPVTPAEPAALRGLKSAWYAVGSGLLHTVSDRL
ncbi:NAD(P)/FAD-dependent oxidoreductase [Paenirhodobacter populi]|uniref:NAD(P)/FAD-dependent oxidoreductase n=1 Tax=Paenirhodobacter populi TaxID=2306993 RepID=UPI000FE304C4|nr:FAD-binding oxidoreductase [Sinirhodobacter populi]RWR10778.1 FAD-binding oxidoreductase [Sinirhodobacter populi]